MDTPQKRKKSILQKIFGQLSVHVEDVGASIEMKKKLMDDMDIYPSQLEIYVKNYILSDERVIIKTAENNLRKFIQPIEDEYREITSNHHHRLMELNELANLHNEEFKKCQQQTLKNRKAAEQLKEVLKAVQNKLHYMKTEYP